MFLFILLTLFSHVLAQYPLPPRGVTTIHSKRRPGASLSYKETHICETTPGVKGFSGYVNLPSSVLGIDYNISTFFWYFEARHKPRAAPLAIYLAGGPGQSSMFAATGQGGPCYINPDSNSTVLNPWSWNNHANVLYIDSPVQTGFSYDVLVNGTLNQLETVPGFGPLLGYPLYTPGDFSIDPPFTTNATTLYGTFPSQLTSQTENSSVQIAYQIWHFAQVWVNEFPKYATKNRDISVWTHSYGGIYGPLIASYFQRQNHAIRKERQCRGCTWDTIIEINTLGLIQGTIDFLLQAPYYPQYSFNNTYDQQIIDEETYQAILDSTVGLCQDLLQQCRDLANKDDPQFLGNIYAVNDKCFTAINTCVQSVVGPAAPQKFSNTDISQTQRDPYPYGYTTGFLNQNWVQEALGVPLNFSAYSNAAAVALQGLTGDPARANITTLDAVLRNGMKVAMVYGDRDFQANWLLGENISLSLDFPGAEDFRASGYANIVTNNSYIGGVVRQSGHLSFSRVFEAGHYVHAAQPETLYRIFNRTLSNCDVATGKKLTNKYHSKGPSSSFGIKNTLPESGPNICNTWEAQLTCSQDQINALSNGTAVVEDYIVIEPTTADSWESS